MKHNTESKHLKQLAESLNANWQTQPEMTDDDSNKNEYMRILKESLIEFDKATTHKGPVEDLLAFNGEGELNTHKGVKGLVDILERSYHKEDDYDFLTEADSDDTTLPVGDGPGKDTEAGVNHDPDEKDLGDLATKTAEGQSSGAAGKPTTGVDKPNAGSGGTGILPNGSQPDAQKNTIMAQNDATSASQETAMKFEAKDLLQEEEAKAEKLPPVATGENEPAGEDAMTGSAPELGDDQDETGFEAHGEEERGKMVESIFEGLDEICEDIDESDLAGIEGEDEIPSAGGEEIPAGDEVSSDEIPSEVAGIGGEEVPDEDEIADIGEEEEPSADAIECLEAEDEIPSGIKGEVGGAPAPEGEPVPSESDVTPDGEGEVIPSEDEDEIPSDEPSSSEIPSEDSIDKVECLEAGEEPSAAKPSENPSAPSAPSAKPEEKPSAKPVAKAKAAPAVPAEVKKEQKKQPVAKKQTVKEDQAKSVPATTETQKKSNDTSAVMSVESLLEDEEEPSKEPELGQAEGTPVLPKPEATIGDDQVTGGEGQVGDVTPATFNQGGPSEGQEATAAGEDLDLSSEPEEIPEDSGMPEEKEPMPGEEDPLEIPAAGEESDQPEIESLDEAAGEAEPAPNRPGDPTGQPGSSITEEGEEGPAVIKNEKGTIPPTTETKIEQAIKARRQVEENVVERLIREMEGFSNSDDLLNEGLEELDENESQED